MCLKHHIELHAQRQNCFQWAKVPSKYWFSVLAKYPKLVKGNTKSESGIYNVSSQIHINLAAGMTRLRRRSVQQNISARQTKTALRS